MHEKHSKWFYKKKFILKYTENTKFKKIKDQIDF